MKNNLIFYGCCLAGLFILISLNSAIDAICDLNWSTIIGISILDSACLYIIFHFRKQMKQIIKEIPESDIRIR